MPLIFNSLKSVLQCSSAIFLHSSDLLSYHKYTIIKQEFRTIKNGCVAMDCFIGGHVHLQDESKVKKIVDNILKDGFSQLQIITDFDMTMTKFAHNGRMTKSTFGVLEDNPMMPEAVKEEIKKNTDYYYPLEIDPAIPSEVKIPLMIEWYEKNFGLIVGSKYQKSDFSEIVKDADVLLRDSCHEVLNIANSKDVPIMIISAGLGDIILEILKFESLLFENLKVVANFMTFDEEGYINGIQNELIHTFNKTIAPLQDPSYIEKVKDRKNVIMLGDSLGDHKMVAHLKDNYNILKIGFLNKNIEASLPVFKDIYDVVLTKDQTWDTLCNLLKKI